MDNEEGEWQDLEIEVVKLEETDNNVKVKITEQEIFVKKDLAETNLLER